jgi:hypothetical protein
MLAPGMEAMVVSSVFSPDTIYNKRYAREGKRNTKGESQMMSMAAGMTMKFVNRK